ncbi:MAG: alpha-ketoacid dehydrogenase subunit beta [Armatimonadetes bacterium]|nr:alpha-ketoacid dehydrogenase subunit beta [Armatimonadota bacterium]
MREILYWQAINEAMCEEMTRDERVLLMGEDVGFFGGAMRVSRDMFDKFGPKRVMDTPLAETAIIGAALGAALTGLRPIAEIMFVDFTTVCFDQIVNQAAKVRYMLGGQVEVPLVIRTQGSAGKSYAAQHSQSFEMLFAHFPGLKVVMPATPYDAKGLLKSAIRENNPVVFIEHGALYNTKGPVPDEECLIPLGKADVKREGRDVTIVAHARCVLQALEASDRLRKESGIEAEVVDLRTIAPMDEQTIFASVKKTGRLVCFEEGHKNIGVGAEVSARVSEYCFDYLDAPIVRVAAMDIPIPCAQELEQEMLPNVDKVVSAVRSLFGDLQLNELNATTVAAR